MCSSDLYTVGNAIIANGAGDKLLAAVFELYFTGTVEDNTYRSSLRTYWIYRYDRRAFYPFVPTGESEGDRDRPTEARLGSDLRRHGLIVEKSLTRSEEHTSELQSQAYLVCRLLLEKKNFLPPLPPPHLPTTIPRHPTS